MNFLNLIQGAAGKVKGVATLLSGLTKTQAIIAGVATVTAVGGVGTGGYFLYDHFHQPEPIVADVVISTEVAEPTEEVVAAEEVVTEETEAAEPETVTLVGSSIEKDLKIKIQDESSKNVKGQPFEITIKADKKKAKSTTYSDDDKDGIIYIKSIDAGKYDVSLNEIDGYISKENSYKLTVKDKIEYTKVDVKDEIKSASEVAPAEDAEVDNVEVEAVIQDTVETVDSTCTPSKVGAGDVDTSNFPKASVGGSTKVDIAQAAVTASAKRVGYHATGNEGETVPSTATKEPSHLKRNNRQKVELIRVTIQEIRVETAKVEQQAELLEAETVRVDRLQEVQKNQSQIQNQALTTLQLHIFSIRVMERQRQIRLTKKKL